MPWRRLDSSGSWRRFNGTGHPVVQGDGAIERWHGSAICDTAIAGRGGGGWERHAGDCASCLGDEARMVRSVLFDKTAGRIGWCRGIRI